MSDLQQVPTLPIERSYQSTLEYMRNVQALAECERPEDVPAELAQALEYDRDIIEEPRETAWELAASYPYAVERLALVEDDGSMGEVRSIELLLAGGGPTVTLTASLRDGEVRDVTYWHSWGSAVGEEATIQARSQSEIETVAQFLSLAGLDES